MKEAPLFLIFLLFITALMGCYDVKTSTGPTINYTNVSGELTNTLTLSGSPYAITGDSYIPSGSTWKIEPGVEIRFGGFYRLTVDGVIEAIGTPTQPIHFGSTYYNNAKERGNWEGIVLTNPNETSIFENCIIEDGAVYSPAEIDTVFVVRGAVHCDSSSPVFRKCLFIDNGFNAIYADGGSAPLIDGCTITGNAFSGVVCTGGSQPYIRNSILVSNDDYGIVAELNTSSAPKIEYCDIWDNFTTDVYGINFDTSFWPGIVSLDPEFIDPDLGDYGLLSHSPCIDAGNPNSIIDPDGSRRDMGAFYYDQSNLSELRNAINQKWDTLTTQYSPYIINANIWVEEGGTLVIDPGVILEFNAETELRFSFDIYGTLIAKGSADNPIIIRSKGKDMGGSLVRYKGDWDQLNFHSTSVCSLSYFQVLHASDVTIESDIFFQNCCFKDNKNSVKLIESASQFDLCVFQNNGISGLHCENVDSFTTITHCIFIENQGYGLICNNYSKPIVKNNIFVKNTVHGLKCYNFSLPQVVNNNFIDNAYYGIYCVKNSSAMIRNNIIYANDKGGIVCAEASYPTISYSDSYFHFKIDTLIEIDPITGDTLTFELDTTWVDYHNCPANVGELTITNNNEDSCDIYYNINLDPLLVDSLGMSPLPQNSPCIDAGKDLDGNVTDMGAFGGPGGDWTPPAIMNVIMGPFIGGSATRK